ncbi:MAG TPA: GNAT family N-acetyltransferase [Anaerolineales bacterium]|nr:GNAT family N-acetyltransferase [Anaerolineales bacterium]
MLELTPPDFPLALPLLSRIPQAVLPHAICQGINPGRVFVDQRPDPNIALAWTTVGYFLLAGDPAAADLPALSHALTDVFVPASQAGGESGFILIPSEDGWKEHLPALLPGREVIEIYRRPFAFDPVHFAASGNWRSRIPAGYRLQALDAALAEQAGVRASWASIEDFLAHGLGFALLDGDEIASLCSSVFASREKVEIDVHTGENYRRRGLATLTAAALIEACLQVGKQPNWECFWDNEPSTALAQPLGFTPLPDYPVYYWEETGQG